MERWRRTVYIISVGKKLELVQCMYIHVHIPVKISVDFVHCMFFRSTCIHVPSLSYMYIVLSIEGKRKQGGMYHKVYTAQGAQVSLSGIS